MRRKYYETSSLNIPPTVARVIPSQAARDDLVAIRLYSIEQFGREVADEYFLGFDSAFDLLASYPAAGSATPQYGKAYRCLIHRRHRIFYAVKDDIVRIVRILHHAVDAKRTLKRAVR
jgi:toxin ParE1/3/4